MHNGAADSSTARRWDADSLEKAGSLDVLGNDRLLRDTVARLVA